MNAKRFALIGVGLVIGGLIGAGIGLGYYTPFVGIVIAAAIGLMVGVVAFRNRWRDTHRESSEARE